VNLEAFGVKNLRCLADTGLVPIRPITVLVGRNSSGKSTFLRAFPLLRQSVETARNSPILWYHERYVDFGSLADAANNELREPSVTFQFRLRVPKEAYVAIGDPLFDIAMTLAGGETPYVSAYEIRVEGHDIRWGFDARSQVESLAVNGESVTLKGELSLGGKAFLLPTLQPGDTSGVSYQAAQALVLTTNYDMLIGDGPLEPSLALSAKNVLPNNIDSDALVQLSFNIIRVSDLVLAYLMSRIAYLAPLRVIPQRAYRIQNLAVDEVDPDGKNLAMFLRSLSPEEVKSFAEFTRDALGFETTVKTTGHHAEIHVKSAKARRFVNLVDVGFGYSEVLPLAAVLWASCVRPRASSRAPAPIVAIEQPELHLHPAHQAKLAGMIANAMLKSRGEGGGSTILVETHSESLINGLGKLVYEGVIKAEDIQIALFDQDEETEQTTVRLAGYRENGALHDWPYGFLSPVAERRAPKAAAE
jgi:predicted ATPase